MVRLDDEATSLEIRVPMAYGVDEADELAFVRGESTMPRGDGPAEERDRVALLDEHGAEAMRRRVHSTMKGLVKSGMARIGADVTAALRAVKAAAASSPQEKPSFLRRAVNGAATAP